MRIDVNTSLELMQLSQKQLLFEQLIKQIQKDFVRANVPLHIPLDLGPKPVTTLLVEKIYFLLMERFSDYLNLLYIIDVPEQDFQHIKMTDIVEVANTVTFLILKREYQKVWYKKLYE